MPSAAILDSLRQRWKNLSSERTIVSKAGPLLNIGEGEVALLTYTSSSDKMRIFSDYIREGLENGDFVDYTYPEDEKGTVRDKLKQYGIDVEKHEKNGALKLRSTIEYYMRDGKFNKEEAIRRGVEEREEAKKKGFKHFRELDDIGDLSFLKGQWQTFIDAWDDSGWGLPEGSGVGILYEPFLVELTAINVEHMSKDETQEILKAFGGGKCTATRVLDFIEHQDAFSKRINTSHLQLRGSKILLEFDPTSDYEKVVEDFVKEAVANFEPICIFTSSASAVRECLAKQPSISCSTNFFLMSVAASVPEALSKNETILPAKNAPIILNSINEVLKLFPDVNVFFVFDSLSELILLVGFDDAYKLLRFIIEMLPADKATALFLLNPAAHDSKIVSMIRSMFNNQLGYNEKELKVVKISKS